MVPPPTSSTRTDPLLPYTTLFRSLDVGADLIQTLHGADVWRAVALAPFLLAVGICPWLMRGRVDSLGSKAREVAGELAAHAVDSVQGLGEIVGNRQERRRGEDLDRLTDAHVGHRMPFFRELTAQSSLLEIGRAHV